MKPVRPLKVLSKFQVAGRAARLLQGFTLAETSAGTGIPQWRLVAFEQGITELDADEFGALWRFLRDTPPLRVPRETRDA